MTSISWSLLAFLVVPACAADNGSNDSNPTESSSNDSSSSSDETAGMSMYGSTGEPPVGTSGPGDDGGACVAPQPSTCSPAEVLDGVDWDVDVIDAAYVQLDDLPCVVAEIFGPLEDGRTLVTFTCTSAGFEDQHQLFVPPDPALSSLLPIDRPIRISHREDSDARTGHWFTIRAENDGSLLLAGIHASQLDFEEVPDLLEPLAFSVAPDDTCDEECGEFLGAGEPTTIRRVALDVAHDGETTRIFDGNTSALRSGAFTVIVGDAFDCVEGSACDAETPAWFSVLVTATPP
ncbi:MAG: hypothetical protein IAG13_36895 [Deltaproteobacteria bacterium]|nr:hypothetical protein [Nannocystaceae bacterium]